MDIPMSPEVLATLARLPVFLLDAEATERYGEGGKDGEFASERRIELADAAEECRRELEEGFEVAFLETEEDWEFFDQIVEKGWPQGLPTEEELAAIALSWGAFLGESVLFNVGGEWWVRPDPQHESIRFGRVGLQFFPAHAVLRRFALGTTASLAACYQDLLARLIEE